MIKLWCSHTAFSYVAFTSCNNWCLVSSSSAVDQFIRETTLWPRRLCTRSLLVFLCLDSIATHGGSWQSWQRDRLEQEEGSQDLHEQVKQSNDLAGELDLTANSMPARLSLTGVKQQEVKKKKVKKGQTVHPVTLMRPRVVCVPQPSDGIHGRTHTEHTYS